MARHTVTMTDVVKVAVGQIWEDNDPRSAGRTIRITEVDQAKERARGEVLSVARNVGEHQVGHRTRWIKFSRFRPVQRGYRLRANPETGTSFTG
jgi:hypothetical protein